MTWWWEHTSSCLVMERRQIVLVKGNSAVIRNRDLQYMYAFRWLAVYHGGYLRDECLKALTLVSPILQKMGSIYSNTVIGPFPLAPAFFLFCSARVYWPIIYFFPLKLIKICSAWINYAHKYFLFFFFLFLI